MVSKSTRPALASEKYRLSHRLRIDNGACSERNKVDVNKAVKERGEAHKIHAARRPPPFNLVNF